ncbi:uncharacterized protein PG998_009619 [Apiospora kogelbergensis]|uniref:uncharacterized protein n=1 Tax=Apiospora kogelbergensis TaxID=1337665 RepID=UPI00312E8342
MLGRVLLTVDSIGLLFGAIMADMGPTHMQNPNWPPHAKFHNAQTISLSVILGAATLFYTWRKPLTPRLRREYMGISAFTGSIYWAAGLVAILFPETTGLDPEFGGPAFPQAPIFVGFGLCGLIGSWLEAA